MWAKINNKLLTSVIVYNIRAPVVTRIKLLEYYVWAKINNKLLTSVSVVNRIIKTTYKAPRRRKMSYYCTLMRLITIYYQISNQIIALKQVSHV